MAGTGSQAVREFAGLFNSFDLLLMHQADAGQLALAAGISMAASLLRSELHGADAAPTLRHMFGGGYEVAIFADGAFCKLGDMTFVIWEADVTDGIRLSHPQLILKQQYWNDILLIRSARIKTNDSKLELFDQQFHSVLPMYGVSKDIETEELLKLSLQSDLTCHCFFVRENEGLALYFYIDRCLPNTESTMTVEEREGVVNVIFSSKFTQQVVANILS
ncbi:MAG TPA: hypothetical protein VK165_06275 [Azonexus sp.]|nr:hypothetical protein [Azonexus sp.]